MDRRIWIGVSLVVLLALTIRAGHGWGVSAPPLSGEPVQDARYYHERALDLLRPTPVAVEGVSFMNLGYPYVVAGIYTVVGASPLAVVAVQLLLGATTCFLLGFVAWRLTGDAVAGLFAALLYALYGPAIFYEGLLLTPALTNFLLAVALAGLTLFLRSGRLLVLILSGAIVGLAILIRPNVLLLLILLAAAVARCAQVERRGRRAVLVALLLGGALCVVGPVVLRNGIVHGEWAPVSANGGANFWIGNNRHAEGIYHAADFVEQVDLAGERDSFLAEARRRSGDASLGLTGASRFWLREGLRDIAGDPGRWLRVEARKIALFWNGYETKTNVGLEFVRDFSPVLDRWSWGFGAIAILGVAGAAHLALSRRRETLWFASAFVAASGATCLLFFVSGEYRHPAALGLCLAGGFGLAGAARWLVGLVRERARPSGLLRPGIWVPWAVGALMLPVVMYRFPPLELTCHPRLDYANHAKTICSPPPGGGDLRPGECRRALDLLQRRPELQDDLFLLEARLAVATSAALAVDEREWVVEAVRSAQAIVRADSAPAGRPYPERFLVELPEIIRSRADLLASLPVVRGDPELVREVETLRTMRR